MVFSLQGNSYKCWSELRAKTGRPLKGGLSKDLIEKIFFNVQGLKSNLPPADANNHPSKNA